MEKSFGLDSGIKRHPLPWIHVSSKTKATQERTENPLTSRVPGEDRSKIHLLPEEKSDPPFPATRKLLGDGKKYRCLPQEGKRKENLQVPVSGTNTKQKSATLGKGQETLLPNTCHRYKPEYGCYTWKWWKHQECHALASRPWCIGAG